MKTFLRFLGSTIVGGLLAIIPIAILALLIGKLLNTVVGILKPFANRIPFGLEHPAIVGAVVLALLCFLAGLILKSSPGASMLDSLERNVLNHLPGYELIRSLTRRMAGAEHSETLAPALAEIEEALVPAFIVERHSDQSCTVFVPSCPTVGAGALYILTPERVHPVNVPMHRMIKCITRFGMGSGDLLAAMHKAK